MAPGLLGGVAFEVGTSCRFSKRVFRRDRQLVEVHAYEIESTKMTKREEVVGGTVGIGCSSALSLITKLDA